jgi:hypothetical protein
MKHIPPPTKSSANWKELYIAALFERDKSKFSLEACGRPKSDQHRKKEVVDVSERYF